MDDKTLNTTCISLKNQNINGMFLGTENGYIHEI